MSYDLKDHRRMQLELAGKKLALVQEDQAYRSWFKQAEGQRLDAVRGVEAIVSTAQQSFAIYLQITCSGAAFQHPLWGLYMYGLLNTILNELLVELTPIETALDRLNTEKLQREQRIQANLKNIKELDAYIQRMAATLNL